MLQKRKKKGKIPRKVGSYPCCLILPRNKNNDQHTYANNKFLTF